MENVKLGRHYLFPYLFIYSLMYLFISQFLLFFPYRLLFFVCLTYLKLHLIYYTLLDNLFLNYSHKKLIPMIYYKNNILKK
jgi:hypothetical protein